MPCRSSISPQHVVKRRDLPGLNWTPRDTFPLVSGTIPLRARLGDGEPACRRGSVHRALAGHRMGGHPSERPTWDWSEDRAGSPWSLFGLAPGGVCRATRVTPGAGALLPHRFTLTCAGPEARHRRSVLCGTFLRVTPTGSRRHPALWSPDLPRRRHATPRPPGRLTVPTSVPGRDA
jgi:hypothetical protein